MNYYNEFDPNAAAWLRQLIAEGLIPPGEVDQRSITDVTPNDLSGFTQHHFFAGIGGWSLALQLAGWPADRPVWTGSCPCQPFSVAGKGKGNSDERHLWPAFFNLIRKCRPDVVFGEQVESAVGHGWLDGIRADLEAENYACGDATLGAHSVGAPHIRQRLYWVADAQSKQWDGGRNARGRWGESANCGESNGGMANSVSEGLQGYGRDVGEGSEPGRVGAQPTGSVAESRAACGIPNAVGERWGGRKGSSEGCLDDGENAGRIESHDGLVGSLQAGFWDDSVWILCRDGKHRRIPTEPIFQLVADGIPTIMGNRWNNLVKEIEGKIIAYAASNKTSPGEDLRALLSAAQSQADEWQAGGLGRFQKEKVLLSSLLQLKGTLGRLPESALQGIHESPSGEMRDLRNDTREYETTSCSSQGLQLEEQYRRQFADIVHELSHENPQFREAIALAGNLSGFPLSDGLPYKLARRGSVRPALLKGAGNAIVPQVAAMFIAAFMDTE